ncbi:hypothetical protein HDU98_011333 [Podochytrium sp. JEL0797]|nr:hypothetical protein HDU98_011333 [Podochytrium sp. JEL0797]
MSPKPTDPTTGIKYVPDLSIENFIVALVANVGLAVGFLLAFVVLRPLFPVTYQPRVTALPPAKRPNELSKSIFSALWVVKANHKELLEKCGPDAYAAIFYARTIMYLFLSISLPAAIILIPINATGGQGLRGMNILTIGNVQNRIKLWLHFFFTIYVCVMTLYAIFSLISIFNRICPDSVETVILSARVPSKLRHQVKQQLNARNHLEAAITKYFSRVSKHPSADPDLLYKKRPISRDALLFGEKFDAIAHYSIAFRKYQVDIMKTHRMLGMDNPAAAGLTAASTAFVVFREPFQASLASRTAIHDAPAVMSECIPCVASQDVVWETSNMSYFARQWRLLASRFLFFILLISWAAFVTSALAVANLANIAIYVPIVDDFITYYPRIAQMIGGILPPAIVATLIKKVPPILRFLSTHAGSPLKTKTEQDVLSQFFFFQLCNVILVNIVGTSLLASFYELKEDPSSVFRLLSTSIPQSANFFIQYLLVTGMTRPSNELFQTKNLIQNPIKAWLFGRTPRTLFAQTQPPEWLYAADMGAHGITVSIGLIFCVVAPIASVFATIYFGFYYAVYLYQFQYVYVIKNETGGKFLFVAAQHMFVGLFIMEFMLTVLFSVALNFTLVGLMLIIVAITLWSFSQAQSFLSVINSIPVKTILDMEGTSIPCNPTVPYEVDETLKANVTRAVSQLPRLLCDHTTDEEDEEEYGNTKSWRTKLATNVSETLAFLSPGQDSSKYSQLVSYFFPGLVATVDAVSLIGSTSALAEDTLAIPDDLFTHPDAGITDLNVWIPDSTNHDVMRSVENEIVKNERVVARSRVVECGASINAKGKVELGEGMYELMRKIK